MLYISKYKSNVRFSFKHLSKIENSCINRVEKKRNLVKYVKNKIFPCRKKKKFSVQAYRQKSENVPNLQVMRKETRLSHLRSNKTARTRYLTNWIALIGGKIKSQREGIVLTAVTLHWARDTAFRSDHIFSLISFSSHEMA